MARSRLAEQPRRRLLASVSSCTALIIGATTSLALFLRSRRRQRRQKSRTAVVKPAAAQGGRSFTRPSRRRCTRPSTGHKDIESHVLPQTQQPSSHSAIRAASGSIGPTPRTRTTMRAGSSLPRPSSTGETRVKNKFDQVDAAHVRSRRRAVRTPRPVAELAEAKPGDQTAVELPAQSGAEVVAAVRVEDQHEHCLVYTSDADEEKSGTERGEQRHSRNKEKQN